MCYFSVDEIYRVKLRMKKEKIDLFIMIIFPIIALILSFLFNANFLLGIVFFLVFPSIYLTLRYKKSTLKKNLFFSIIYSVPLTFIADYLAVINRIWDIDKSFYKIFGIVSIEQFLFSFFFIYFVVMFYNHFSNREKNLVASRKIKYLFLFLLLILAILFLFIAFNPSFLELNLKYPYLILGILFVLTPILVLFKLGRKLFPKFVISVIYFFFFDLIYEITALKLNHWEFIGTNFLWKISFSNIWFPIEEVVFWMIFIPIQILLIYEFFADDKK